jgi:hypothetical protein
MGLLGEQQQQQQAVQHSSSSSSSSRQYSQAEEWLLQLLANLCLLASHV